MSDLHIVQPVIASKSLISKFDQIRAISMEIVEPLEPEDYVVQPITDVSPPKWHLAHTTWFFEVFLLQKYDPGYRLYNDQYPYLFNSYYVSAGDRWTRAHRGALTRPTVEEIKDYRRYVEENLRKFLERNELTAEQAHIMEVGLNHEQQHQELMLYDIKYILGANPLFPSYRKLNTASSTTRDYSWLHVQKGNYSVGHDGSSFCFDNEMGKHEVHLEEYEIADRLVTNGEYLEFLLDGGYDKHRYWLSDGWDWIRQNDFKQPLYWHKDNGQWFHYTFDGLRALDLKAPAMHLSYYEADAFAKWCGYRLPTEYEWEIAAKTYGDSDQANYYENGLLEPKTSEGPDFMGNLWEWTSSAYLPYPFYKAPDGALGEYNGKFMVNQHVLRGGSFATSSSHMRVTYRNFFHPQMRWLFSGLRLARHLF